MKCEYCDKNVKGRGVLLINLLQKPSVRVFCSKKCKIDWSFTSQKGIKKKAVVWAIGAYYNKSFFIQKVINISASRRIYSRFTKNLNKIEKLELVNDGILKYLRVAKV